jgi:hypothetical protein
MSMPSTNPTIAELYLAFRQAKTALYFERRGVGLLELAKYEAQLPANLNALKRKVANGKWFDGVKIGETWVVPKRLNETEESNDGVVRIGLPKSGAQSQSVDVQLRLSPHPDFAIVEVLYLWRFGGLLDSLLSKRDVLGYRLDLRKQQVGPHRRWLFEYWPKQYQAFRTAPLRVANASLKQGDETLIVSGDLASFYDTIDPSFMRSASMIAELSRQGASKEDLAEYERATGSLLKAYARFHREASERVALPIALGVPIGALTSRVVANLSLATLDRHVVAQRDVLCYRRYVDDLVIVARAMPSDKDVAATIRRFLPLVAGDADVLRLDVDALDRQRSEFQLQKKKVRVHRLHGIQGSDFVEAVAADFKKVVSEHRAFVDSSTFAGDGVSHLIRVGEANGSPLRVLREADRARLERFALATSLASLERVSSLIGYEEARELVRTRLERFGRVLADGSNWVADLDVSLRLLKVAVSVGDWKSVGELVEQMDLLWGTIERLQKSMARLRYRGQDVPLDKKSPRVWMRNYLHERRIEAFSTALPIGLDASQLADKFPGGLRRRTEIVGATALRRRAEQLASADLRARDREDDAPPDDRKGEIDRDWLRNTVRSDSALSQRLAQIDKFVARCEELDDRPWLMPAARLFLCTRPPSYFDIARRWLHRAENEGFATDVFNELLAVVNAVRGTEYADAVGEVLDPQTVSIGTASMGAAQSGPCASQDPRIILGNLSVYDDEWIAAASRTHSSYLNSPSVTAGRLERVARILDYTFNAARRRVPAVLVLPELALPRKWFRAVSNHVVRRGQFGLVTGLEYLHDPSGLHVRNQVVAVLPGPFGSAATFPWTKRLPAREEETWLATLKPPVSFAPPPSGSPRRTVVRSPWGDMSVLVCSELLEAQRIADLVGRVSVVFCPAWNKDTSSFDHLIKSAGLQLHAIVAIANNGRYSDCRAWAPKQNRPERELCRLIERDLNGVVQVDIPLHSLVAFHQGFPSDEWRPLPPHWPFGEL